MKRTCVSVTAAIGLLLLALSAPGAMGQDQTFERRTPVVKVYQDTHTAVVNIAGERAVSGSGWGGFGIPDTFDFWGRRFRAKVAVLGSGLVVHEDGYVISNAHVVKDTEKLRVVFSDGNELPATIISSDESKDLAVLRVSAQKRLPFIRLGRSNDLMIGETVIAIGNPYGYANTVTSGVISAIGRDIEVSEGFWLRGLIQTDAPINPGNSGGPLLNVNGELIGVNTAIRAEAQNIGFAIPVDTLADNLSHMLMPEKLRRVRLGLTMGRMTRVGELTGLVVDSVSKASPADRQGIAAGDVVLDIDGRTLTGIIDFYVKLMNKEVGEPIELSCVRPVAGLRSRTVKLTMQPRPLPDGRALVSQFFQMEVSELTDRVARRFDFEGAYPILIISDVERRGVARQAGFQEGDLILEINGATVRNVTELSLEMEKVHEADKVQIKILRIAIGVFGQVQRQYVVTLQAQSANSSGFM
ncbi:MAG: trypsin-like peptidase domain-containing protein [Phycisphaerales bacterium]|nr:MAG: trypsin-like peptidase domain-containing protein [Phycisphaerales bacterium]